MSTQKRDDLLMGGEVTVNVDSHTRACRRLVKPPVKP
jgi:hypothetical protein